MIKAESIFTPDEIRLIKLICKIFNGRVTSIGKDRSTDTKEHKT